MGRSARCSVLPRCGGNLFHDNRAQRPVQVYRGVKYPGRNVQVDIASHLLSNSIPAFFQSLPHLRPTISPQSPPKNPPMRLLPAILCGLLLSEAAFLHAGDTAAPARPPQGPFGVDVRGLPSNEPPMVNLWRKVLLDAEYGGKFVIAGDVDGDREVEIVAAKNVNVTDDHYTSAVSVQNLDGSILWRWGNPNIGRRNLHHDVACQIHDLDADGKPEVIVAADKEVVILEGATGKVKSRFPIPKHASDCVTFADLKGAGHRGEILVKTRYTQIWAYTADGKLLWTVKEPGGYRTAHQPYPVDLDGDGREEILAGYAALNPNGSVRWVFELDRSKRNGGHADCWRVIHLAKDPKDTRLVMTMCGGNALVMTDGAGGIIWKQTGRHYESVDAGEIRPDVPGKELVVDVDHLRVPEKPLCLFSQDGNLLGRYLTDYTRHHALLDWNADGIQEIGSALTRRLFDGNGNRVVTFAIPQDEEAYDIQGGDFTGDGNDDAFVITLRGEDVFAYIFTRKSPPPISERVTPTGSGGEFHFLLDRGCGKQDLGRGREGEFKRDTNATRVQRSREGTHHPIRLPSETPTLTDSQATGQSPPAPSMHQRHAP